MVGSDQTRRSSRSEVSRIYKFIGQIMINNLIIFSVGFISVCVSAFIFSLEVGLLVVGLGLMTISLLFDFEKL